MRLQRIRNWRKDTRVVLVLAVLLTGLVFVALAPRIPIGPFYHDFADKRTMLGVPNALNVLSNGPFIVVGIWALVWLSHSASRAAFLYESERITYMFFFVGVALTGFGSFWYHLAPASARLPWDLLPMTCSFVSIISATVMERISQRVGFVILIPLIIAGVSAVIHWDITGDYKYYLFVQFFSPILLILIIGLFPPRYSGIWYLIAAFSLYVLAKTFEFLDYPVYQFRGLISGHALKHITAAVSCFYILRMLQVRKRQTPLAPQDQLIDSHDKDELSWARQ